MRQDRRSFERQADFTRRQFVVTTLAAGFALAVRPVRGDTIMTDAQGLEAGEVKIPVAGGEIPGYRARPQAAKKAPMVLVVQEIFGVHEHIRDVCRRLAKLGYVAIAPELYARQGDVSKIADVQEIMSRVVSKVPDSQVMSDLDAAAAWGARTGGGDGAKLGITGFCWGGRIVWLYAAHNPRLSAGVAWYGRLEGPTDELHPKNPIDVASSLEVPVLGLYGGADQGIPLDSVERMRKALTQAKKPCEIVVYPDAPHGFHADYRPSYRQEAAVDGWNRLRSWFAKHGLA
jgi:carboxymethylenebutenolidase